MATWFDSRKRYLFSLFKIALTFLNKAMFQIGEEIRVSSSMVFIVKKIVLIAQLARAAPRRSVSMGSSPI